MHFPHPAPTPENKNKHNNMHAMAACRRIYIELFSYNQSMNYKIIIKP